jgi:hypothetical protein
VRRVGLEPTRPHGQQSLSLPCLPIPASPRTPTIDEPAIWGQIRTDVLMLSWIEIQALDLPVFRAAGDERVDDGRVKHAVRACALVVIASVATGCSNGGPTPGVSAPATSAAAPSSALETPATTAGGSIGTATPSTGATPGPSSPGQTAPPSTTPRPSSPTVAEAGGWRLVITRPEAGATVRRTATICYQATGTTRESSVALDVSAVPPGSSAVGTPTRLPALLGAGSVQIDLSSAPRQRFDLRIGLVGDGQVVAGVVVTIPELAVGAASPAVVCP